MDMHRILFIHGPPHTLLLHKQKQKQWAAGWCEHVCALYKCPSVCQYAWAAYGDHFSACGARLQRGYVPYLGHTYTRTCHVGCVHRIQDRVLMDGCGMDVSCVSASVMANMYKMHILGLICMWDAYSTLMCTVSWSYKRHHASCS